MLNCIRQNKPCVPDWVPELAMRRPRVILTVVLFLTVVFAVYSVLSFRIDTDFSSMVSPKLAFRRELTAFRRAFPQLNETLVVVVDSATPEKTRYARDFMAERFQRFPKIFRSVFVPGGGRFYNHNGLLYLNLNELSDLMDRLANVQPLLGLLSQELSLGNLFGVLSRILTENRDEIDTDRLNLLLTRIRTTMEMAIAGQSDWISWESMMGGNMQAVSEPGLILLWPYLEKTGLNPAQSALETIRKIKDELKEYGIEDVSVRTTGELALKIANLKSAEKSIGIATAVSLTLVALVLIVGLKSFRLLFYSLSVLFIGLIWTLGFAMIVIGRLNLISVTFVVLFIGLGIDYSIQYCLRYRELTMSGSDHSIAIRHTGREVGNALLLCTMTTAIGFYAFVPTAYTGASELGLISGTGMFINFAANMIVLPALLHLGKPKFASSRSATTAWIGSMAFLPSWFPKIIVFVCLLAGLLGAASIFRVYFDFNPLNLHDPVSESVSAAKDLLKNPKTSPWTISVLTDGASNAAAVVQRLERLESVDRAISIFGMVPKNQEEKIEMIGEMSLFIPQMPEEPKIVSHPVETIDAIASFRRALSNAPMRERLSAATPLIGTLDDFLSEADRDRRAGRLVDILEQAMLMPLKLFWERLEKLVKPYPFTVAELPPALRSLYISNGLYRVQVFPNKNIDKLDEMENFVDEVKRVAPNATGSPVGIVAAGKAVSHAFVQAFFTALAGIVVFLALVIRNKKDVLLMVLPLLVALGWTIGTMAFFGWPFNFANIIAIPLLLGIGLDYAVHIIYRYRSDLSSRGNILGTSAARGVLFGALTTVVSFSSLLFSAHRGMAGMGLMLTICISFIIGATLVLLPALLYLFSNR